MSKNETPQGNSKDVFSACQENVDMVFAGVKQSVPRYHQSITNVQQEYLQAFENIVNSSITLQNDYVKKIGMATNVPETTLKIVHATAEEFVKTFSLQNQIVLATMDATQQNIKTFNDHVQSFVDLNRNILQSWISALPFKK